MRDRVSFNGIIWGLDLGGIAGKIPIANFGNPSPVDFKYHHAGEQWFRFNPFLPFSLIRFVNDLEHPTGVFFTPHVFSSTSNALEKLHLTGWNNPNYAGMVLVTNPKNIDVSYITGTQNIQVVIEEQSVVEYGDFVATKDFHKHLQILFKLKTPISTAT